MADVDILVAVIVVGIIVLIVFAKISGQTIGELLSDLKDLFMDKKESTQEIVTQVYD